MDAYEMHNLFTSTHKKPIKSYLNHDYFFQTQGKKNIKEGLFGISIPIVDDITKAVGIDAALNTIAKAAGTVLQITVGPVFNAVTDAGGFLIDQTMKVYDETLGNIIPLDLIPGGKFYAYVEQIPGLMQNIMKMVGGIGDLSTKFNTILEKSDAVATQLEGKTTGASKSVNMAHFGIYFSPQGCPPDPIYESEKARGFSKAIYGGPDQYASRDLGWVQMLVRNEDIPILIQHGYKVTQAFNPGWAWFRARACLTYKMPGLYSYNRTGKIRVGLPVPISSLGNLSQVLGSENIGGLTENPDIQWFHPYLEPISSTSVDFSLNDPEGATVARSLLGLPNTSIKYPNSPNLINAGTGLLIRQNPGTGYPANIASAMIATDTSTTQRFWDRTALKFNPTIGINYPNDAAHNIYSTYEMPFAIDNVATKMTTETDPVDASCPFGTRLEIIDVHNMNYPESSSSSTKFYQTRCGTSNTCRIAPLFGDKYMVTYRCNK